MFCAAVVVVPSGTSVVVGVPAVVDRLAETADYGNCVTGSPAGGSLRRRTVT